MKPLLTVFLCVALMGCSSTTATDPPPEDEPGELVSYEAIAGDWAGWDHSADFAFRVVISEEAPVGETVGDFRVLRATDSGLEEYCVHVLKADSADPPVYLFDGSVGSCTSTILTLSHDDNEQRIEVSNSQGESGYLIPGSDPGPPPE